MCERKCSIKILDGCMEDLIEIKKPIITTPPPTNSLPFMFKIDTRLKTNRQGETKINQFKLPLIIGKYNFSINWGDGKSNTVKSMYDDLHTYSQPGVYTITIRGTCVGWRFNDAGDASKLTNILEWGNLNLGNIGDWLQGNHFAGCVNLESIESSTPLDLTGVLNLSGCFYDCIKLKNANLSSWNVSNVTDMTYMFYLCINFNSDITSWNVSNVRKMIGMFANADKFKQDLSSWNPINCISFESMFSGIDINENGTTTNYDNLLLSWSTKNLKSGTPTNKIIFDSGLSKYNKNNLDVVNAKNKLINKIWIFNGYYD